jgi:hypothetical protein
VPRSPTSKKKLIATKRAIVRAAKDRPCVDCGKRYPSHVLDFDHVRGIKRCNVTMLVNSGHSIKTLLSEMALCQVVCSNCHRARTHRHRTT